MKKILSLGITFMLFVLTLSSCGSAPDTDHQNADGTTDKVTVTTTEVAVTDATTKTTEEETTTKTDSTTTVATTTTQKADTTTTKKPTTTTTKKPTTTTTTSTTTTSKPTTTTTAATKPITEYEWVYTDIAQHERSGKIYKLSLSGSLSWSAWTLLSEMNFVDGYTPDPEDIRIIHGEEYVCTHGSGGPCEVKIDGKTISIIDLSVVNEQGFVLEQIDEKTMKVVSSTMDDDVPVDAIFIAKE